IRLLDPPLHEFLPDVEELLVREARGGLDKRERKLLTAAQQWREANPMLGTRGCRLGIIKPGLYRMQTKAILEAAIERKLAGGVPSAASVPRSRATSSWASRRRTPSRRSSAKGSDCSFAWRCNRDARRGRA